MSKCGDKRCKTCPDLIQGKEITFVNGKHFEVKSNMSCRTLFVVYSLTCKKCGELYISKTTNMLKQRMTVHRQQTNDANLRVLNVNKHFYSCSGDGFNIFPIYSVSNANENMLEEKEKLFIRILQPSLNAWWEYVWTISRRDSYRIYDQVRLLISCSSLRLDWLETKEGIELSM